MWNWDAVFELLTQKCEELGGYYELSNEEAAPFKIGEIGDGWGEANLRNTVFPQYRARYSDYDFGIGSSRQYIWCSRKKV